MLAHTHTHTEKHAHTGMHIHMHTGLGAQSSIVCPSINLLAGLEFPYLTLFISNTVYLSFMFRKLFLTAKEYIAMVLESKAH